MIGKLIAIFVDVFCLLSLFFSLFYNYYQSIYFSTKAKTNLAFCFVWFLRGSLEALRSQRHAQENERINAQINASGVSWNAHLRKISAEMPIGCESTLLHLQNDTSFLHFSDEILFLTFFLCNFYFVNKLFFVSFNFAFDQLFWHELDECQPRRKSRGKSIILTVITGLINEFKLADDLLDHFWRAFHVRFHLTEPDHDWSRNNLKMMSNAIDINLTIESSRVESRRAPVEYKLHPNEKLIFNSVVKWRRGMGYNGASIEFSSEFGCEKSLQGKIVSNRRHHLRGISRTLSGRCGGHLVCVVSFAWPIISPWLIAVINSIRNSLFGCHRHRGPIEPGPGFCRLIICRVRFLLDCF